MTKQQLTPLGTWQGDNAFQTAENALRQWQKPVYAILHEDGEIKYTNEGQATLSATSGNLLAILPPLSPNRLGDQSFLADHGLDYPYMTGAMANGIASAEVVIAAARCGCLGSYGAAGQRIDMIEAALNQMFSTVAKAHHSRICVNLIHSPNEPAHEMAVVDLLIAREVCRVEASAYLGLTLPAVKYRVHGIHQDKDGRIITPNRIIAKASRVEVATRWFSPPPENFLNELVAAGDITAKQAALARKVPMAQDLTAEADSGGHTDNRPAMTMLPSFISLKEQLKAKAAEAGLIDEFSQHQWHLRVGLGGGIATPESAAAAFALGAAWIVTGTVNQACVESGSSDGVRQMLAEAEQADVTMAPAADMFEMGVKLQVLKRGTLFAMRAQKLYDIYKAYPGMDAIPAKEKAQLEKQIFREPLAVIWDKTKDYFSKYDAQQVAKAEQDPRHKMALTFRWYLGLSSRWANSGETDRKMDFQIWCGPAMGAFNSWTKGTFLAEPKNRTVDCVAMNMLYGATLKTRLNQLQQQLGSEAGREVMIRPMAMDALCATE